jgi:hypothetical protein
MVHKVLEDRKVKRENVVLKVNKELMVYKDPKDRAVELRVRMDLKVLLVGVKQVFKAHEVLMVYKVRMVLKD